MTRRHYLAAGILLLLADLAGARELRWTHFGLRPLAMGNAYVAVADDYNALFYNPAGLARLKTWNGEFFNPTIDIAQNTYQTLATLTKLGSSSSSDITSTLNLFQEESGKVHHAAYLQTPYLIFPHFGLALGLEVAADLVAHSQIDVEFGIGPRLILPIGMAFNFFEDRLSLGASLKLLARGGIDRNFTLDTISAFSKKKEGESSSEEQSLTDFFEGGYGVGADVGLLFTPIDTMQPTLGISISDIGGSSYRKANVGGSAIAAPQPRLPAVNTGISIKPWQNGRQYLLVAADAHMINQPVHFSHKLNLGMEWGFGDLFKVETGLKDGLLTGGFQFDVGLLKLRFATYVVDHGPVVALHSDLAQRRFAIQLKLLI